MTVFKIGEAKHNGTNGLNIRGNVDLTLNDFITAYVNAKVSFYSRRSAMGLIIGVRHLHCVPIVFLR